MELTNIGMLRQHIYLRELNSSLEETSEFCDLGLVTSNKLSWNAHLDKISSKASKILGLIRRTCKGLKDVNTLRRLYCAFVRSQLEYSEDISDVTSTVTQYLWLAKSDQNKRND